MGVLVKLELVQNPKAASVKPFVAKLLEDRPPSQCLEFIAAAVPKFAKKRVLVGGEYDLEEKVPYLVRYDKSYYGIRMYSYELVILIDGELRNLAVIDYVEGTQFFSPPELEMLYAQYRSPIAALWAFWRKITGQSVGQEDVSEGV